jgi:ribonuclease T
MTENINPPQFNQRFHGYFPVVVDIETGGVNPQTDAVLEIAAVFLDMNHKGKFRPDETDAYHILPFEGGKLHKEATAIHGIDPYHPFRMAIPEKRALDEFYENVSARVKRAGCRRAILVGHNANFDLSFLIAANKRCGIKETPFHAFTCFDTATLSALHYGKTVLAKALEAAGIPYSKDEAHAAIYDAKVTADLFCKIVNESNFQR